MKRPAFQRRINTRWPGEFVFFKSSHGLFALSASTARALREAPLRQGISFCFLQWSHSFRDSTLCCGRLTASPEAGAVFFILQQIAVLSRSFAVSHKRESGKMCKLPKSQQRSRLSNKMARKVIEFPGSCHYNKIKSIRR